jgi:hypothetical protein
MKDRAASLLASPGRRAATYWFVDGLQEIVFGVALLVSAASGLLWRLFLPNPPAWHGFGLGVGFVLYFWMGRRVLDLLKSRATYPRTGYVQPPEELERLRGEVLTPLSLQARPPRNENVTSFGWRTATVVFLFLVTPIDGSPRWFVPVLMAALAAALYALNRSSEHPYPWRATLVLGLMGLLSLWENVPPLLRPFLPLLLVASWLLALGGWTLVHYLRENPVPRVSEGART